MSEAPSPSPGTAEPSVVRAPSWRVVAALAWPATLAVLFGLAWAEVWPHRLHDSSRLWVALSYVVFMIETFAFYLGLAVIPAALFAVLTRRRVLAGLAVVSAVWGAGPDTARAVLPSWPSERLPGATLRVLSANVMYARADPDRLLAIIDREKPDVLVIQEWTIRAEATWRPRLETVFAHVRAVPSDDAFGLAIFSRLPMENYRAYVPEVAGVPTQVVDIALGEDADVSPADNPWRIRIANVHVLPPIGLSMFREQRSQTEGLARYALRVLRSSDERDRARGLLMIGDLNATARSGHLRRLREAGLRVAARDGERNPSGTWPRLGPSRYWLSLDLDHALIGGDALVGSARVIEDIGSDHAPIVVDVAWRRP